MLTIGGALYAPNGTVNLQQNGPLTIGALIGSSVSIERLLALGYRRRERERHNSWQMSQ